MFSLQGRVAVITGGAGALGLAAAQALQTQGAHVVLLGRSTDKLQAALNLLNTKAASIHACDVASESTLMVARNDLIATHNHIDILVTCAAAPAAAAPFESIKLEDWRELMKTDLDGVFLACQYFGEPMLKQKFGRIINLTSFHNVATYPNRTAYNAAKSGVEGLSRALAVEWGHHGITVNTIAPGPILTPRTEWFLSQDIANKQGMLARTPSVRLGEPGEFGATVAFLCSDEARHINGQQIVLDGGWTKNAWWGDHSKL